MSLRVLEHSYELATALGDLLRTLDRRNPDLARQIKRAASSVTLNIAEGNGRAGGNRRHCFRIARGSVQEVSAALTIAISWGDLDAGAAAPSLELADSISAMLWGLVR